MTDYVVRIGVVLIVSNLSLLGIVTYLLVTRRFVGKDGKDGVNGIDGRDGINGINGKDGESVEVIRYKTDTKDISPRYEMLKNGLSTGHFVDRESKDYEEIFNTPGLSLKSPDGNIIEGIQ